MKTMQENQQQLQNQQQEIPVPNVTKHPQYKRVTDVEFERYGPTTVARVTLVNTRSRLTVVVGSATRRGDDKENAHIGKLWALQRALDKEQARIIKQRLKFGR